MTSNSDTAELVQQLSKLTPENLEIVRREVQRLREQQQAKDADNHS